MTSEQSPDPVPIDAEEARQNPEDAVDALERRVLGGPEHRLDGGYPDDLSPDEQADIQQDPDNGNPDADSDDETPRMEPAFEIDLDPEDEGSSAAAPRNPD